MIKNIETKLHTLREIEQWKQQNTSFSFIPTMGFLHEGHLSLVRAAKKKNLPVLMSIFVNPRQFGPNEDFQVYPRDLESDIQKLHKEGIDALWVPSSEDIYPEGSIPNIPILPDMCTQGEGIMRPTHFRGVAEVVFRFFEILNPKYAFFGQKDYQQTRVVRWLVKECHFLTEIEVCPIIREKSGLALSSRNTFLSSAQQESAAVLSRSLFALKQAYDAGETNPKVLLLEARNLLSQEKSVSVEYLEMRDAETFLPTKNAQKSVVVLAAKIGKVRLLDNILLP